MKCTKELEDNFGSFMSKISELHIGKDVQN